MQETETPSARSAMPGTLVVAAAVLAFGVPVYGHGCDECSGSSPSAKSTHDELSDERTGKTEKRDDESPNDDPSAAGESNDTGSDASSGNSAFDPDAALEEARRLASEGNHGDALPKFRRVVDASPDDGELHCEAGWSAFRAGELDDAQKFLERGRDLTTSPEILGACLYNLGRLHERRGERSDALDAYNESLRYRPGNEAVRNRLEELGHGAPSGTPVSCPPEGPYPDVDALCAALREEWQTDAQRHDCSLDEIDIGSEATGEWFELEDTIMIHNITHDYLIHEVDGGYRPVGDLEVALASRCSSEERWIANPELRQLIPGGDRELVLEVKTEGSDYCRARRAMIQNADADSVPDLDGGGTETWKSTRHLVCGRRDGRVRCSGLLRESVPTGPGVRDMLVCPKPSAD